MKTFYHVLANTLLATLTNNFLWFALVFWAYIETESVLATSVIGGSYMLVSAFIGIVFGTFVDRHTKKTAMLISSLTSLLCFGLALVVYRVAPAEELFELADLWFWLFSGLALIGALAGNLRSITLSTTVTLLVPPGRHDKANGMVGTVNGVAFVITSVFSGLVIGRFGMEAALAVAITLTLVTLTHLRSIKIKEDLVAHSADIKRKAVDLKGALAAIRSVPGLMALILFTTFNNLLNGVFISLIDPYGLTLVSVEVWGVLLGVLTIGYIAGGLYVAKFGLGKSPLRSLLLANCALWVASTIFPIQASIVLLSLGMLAYNALMPIVESAEQTIIQKVVPFKKQGRVFGFAQSIESAAAPLTAFLIGPVAQFIVIPFMSDSGLGAQLIGAWFGTGPGRGMAVVFIVTSLIGLVVTVLAMKSRYYKVLSLGYTKA